MIAAKQRGLLGLDCRTKLAGLQMDDFRHQLALIDAERTVKKHHCQGSVETLRKGLRAQPQQCNVQAFILENLADD